ncbi:N-acetylmuramoyl-L-alanine amidase, partial [Nocardioides sp.]|uniref:N-acetylmuramoyl-L-alanine amidase n=1 Tax=Nocardioides sp. TaxID=35761 RepID=UPI002B26DCBB
LPEGEDGDSPGRERGLVLATSGGSDVVSVTLPLGDDVAPRVAPRRWESQQLPTSTHSMAALTWPLTEEPPTAYLRSRKSGAWGAWVRLSTLHDGPDASQEAPLRAGTDLMWIGRADGVQVRLVGRRPPGAALVLFHPQARAGDPFLAGLAARRTAGRRSSPDQPVAAPALVGRKQWGADNSLNNGAPRYVGTITQVHVHHTVNSNTYARDDVPALVRGMHAYHTRTLGWSDIGYNFLVDRFGVAYVGRAGGPSKLVRGAHTLGFNAESTGIAAIGNYETATPSDAMLETIAALAAWKLDPFARDPLGRVNVRSEGSDKYSSGKVANLPTIDGHRDTNDTACPGKNLYAVLPKVRQRTAALMGPAAETAVVAESSATVSNSDASAGASEARLGDQLTADPGTYRPSTATPSYRWLRDGRAIRGARAQTYVVRPQDVGRLVTCEVTLAAEGRTPLVQTPPARGPVRAVPALVVSPDGARRNVTVTLTAPEGVTPTPGGEAVVRVGKRFKTVAVVEGRAVARFGGHRRLGAGDYPVTVTYPGDPSFTSIAGATTIRVQ